MTLLPLLVVALIVWAGIFFFVFALDRRVAALERRVQNVSEAIGSEEENR